MNSKMKFMTFVVLMATQAASLSPPIQLEYTCQSIADRIAKICTPERAGFQFTDGCNGIQCMENGGSSSTLKYCPPAALEEPGSLQYCQSTLNALELKLSMSKSYFYDDCLPSSKMCANWVAGEQKGYYNGCNYCNCIGEKDAACTMMMCGQFFGTEQEFARHCEVRNVGFLQQRK